MNLIRSKKITVCVLRGLAQKERECTFSIIDLHFRMHRMLK